MIIHNPILTGSFSVNGADLSTITGSVATSASFDARTTYLESTSSILTAASASQSVTSGSLVAASASLSATSGSLSAASGSFNTRVSALEVTGSALSSSLLTVSGSGYATSASLSAASGSFNTRVATIESKYATTGSNTFIGTQVVSGSILQSGSFTSTGTLTAQTLVIQTITSSVVYSSGSNVFGNSLGNSQVFTGSVLITGSLALAGNITSNGTAVVLGSGTSGYLPKFTGASTIGNSILSENSNEIIINVADPTLVFNGSRDYALQSNNTSGNFRLIDNTAGLARLTLDTSGNLGLGVTPSNAYADSRTFEIGAGGILWSEQAASVYNSMSIGSNFYYNAAGSLLYKNAAVAASRFTQYQGSHIWYTAGVAPSAGAAITFTQAMTLDASGQLGIGTTSPRSVLEIVSGSANTNGDTPGVVSVVGPNKTSTSNTANILITTNDAFGINIGASIGFGARAVGNTQGAYLAGISGRKENANSGDYAGYLQFITRNAAATSAEWMRITSLGNVLIGTTTDNGQKLQVKGNARFNYSDDFGYFGLGYVSGADYGFYNYNYSRTDLLFTQSTGAATFSSTVNAAQGIFSSDFIQNETSKVGISFASGYGQINSWGANTSTYGGLKFQLSVSNGGTITPLTLAPSGAATFSSTINAGGAIKTSGQNSVNEASVLKFSQESSTTSQIAAYGATTGTAGILNIIMKSSDASVNTVALSFASTGAATFSSGIAIGGATATTGGIQFPATAVAIADANNLDDYEEGTWTPTVVAGSGTYTTITNARGTYTKIGRQVTVQFYFIVSDKGTGTASAQITNLPFTAKSTSAGDQYVGSMVNTSTSVISSVAVGQNDTFAAIYKYDGTDPITVSQGNAGSVTYFT